MASLIRRMLAFLGVARSDEGWVYPSNAITRAVEAMLAEPTAAFAANGDAYTAAGEPCIEAAVAAEAAAPRRWKRLRRRSRRADAA